MIIIKKSYHKEKAYNDGTTAYNDKPTAYNDGTTAYNIKPTAYNDETTAYNDKPTTHDKYYHIRQLWRSKIYYLFKCTRRYFGLNFMKNNTINLLLSVFQRHLFQQLLIIRPWSDHWKYLKKVTLWTSWHFITMNPCLRRVF